MAFCKRRVIARGINCEFACFPQRRCDVKIPSDTPSLELKGHVMKLHARKISGASFFPVAALILMTLSTISLAQTTISTGSIQGTITDQSGAVVGDAKVAI